MMKSDHTTFKIDIICKKNTHTHTHIKSIAVNQTNYKNVWKKNVDTNASHGNRNE